MTKRKKGLGANIPGGDGVKPPERKGSASASGAMVKRSYSLPSDVFATLEAAAYWERVPQAHIVQVAVEKYLAGLEKARGKPYEPKPESMRIGAGRPRRGG